VAQVADELERAVAVAAKWAVVEDVPPTQLGDFDLVEWDKEKGRLRQTTRYRIYYMALIVEDAVARMRKVTAGRELKDMEVVRGWTAGYNQKDYMEGLIRDKSKGDLDEFILYTIQYMQFKYMTPHHCKIAQLVRWNNFGEKNFDDMLPPQEIWRLLFPNHFDGVEDYFDKFFDAFTNECILYFLVDYLSYDYNIQLIPIYNVYTADGGKSYSADVAHLIDKDKIDKDIRRIEEEFKWT
jgi:hypothetical protein